jgi:hypothetical protein
MADLVGIYQFDFLRPVPTTGVTTTAENAAAVLWTLVHQLTGQLSGITGSGLWVCMGSGNGQGSGGSGSMDGVNRWNGVIGGPYTYDGTFNKALMKPGVNYGDPATQAGAWMVLHNAALGVHLMFMFGPAYGGSVDPFEINVRASYNAFTGGGVATRPTGTVIMTGESPSGEPGIDWMIVDPRAGGLDTYGRKVHLALADDGAFFWGETINGVVQMNAGLLMGKMLDPLAGDTKTAILAAMSNHYNLYNTSVIYPSSSYPGRFSAWGLQNLVYHRPRGSESGEMGSVCSMTHPNGISAGHAHPLYPMAQFFGNTAIGTYCCTLPRLVGFDTERQLWPEMPVWVYGPGGVRGRIRDLWLAYPQTEGTVDPSGVGPIKRVFWGDFWVPSPDALFSFS